METKLQALCDKITIDQHQRLKETGLDCQCNLDNAVARYIMKRKYTNIDLGGCGKYMIVNATGEIYGIKGYGVIHRGHYFGTLDTINDYFWGEYRAYKLTK